VSQVRTTAFLDAIGRVKLGVSLAQAQADMDRVAGLIEKAYPGDVPKAGVILRDLQESASGDVRPTLLLLLAAAGVVFLIACADVGGLILARAMRRQGELIVRVTVGASRWRLTRQLLVESAVLAVAGGAAGLWLAGVLGGPLARTLEVGDQMTLLDIRVFAFAFAAAALASVIFSLAPALHVWASDLMAGLRESATASSDSRRQKRLHAALVTIQIALATAMLHSAGLLTLSMMRLQHVELGFQPDHVLTFPVALPSTRYAQERRAAVFDDLLARLRTLPGVRTAAASSQLPMMGAISRTVLSSVAGTPIPQNRRTGIAFASVTPGMFRSLGIAMRQGREFDAHDRAGAAPVVIINEAAARRYFKDRDPVGQQILPEMWNGSGSPTQPRTIVGVAADVKTLGLDRAAIPTVYWPVAQIPSNPTMFVTLLTQGNPLALLNGVRAELRSFDHDLPLYNVRPMSSYVDSALERPRRTAALIVLLAAFALTLTAVGIYGTVALSVARRTREIGIRMALGAGARDVLRGFLADAARMGIAGVILAAPLVGVADKLFKGLLFGVSGSQSWMFAAGAVGLLLVAILASYIPARRATRIDPMVALRWE
jgi:putative ABC transport system permease protein